MINTLLIFQISANFFLLSDATIKLAGPFYTVNEGFFPRVYNSEVLSYKTELKPLPNDYEDKRMYGTFEVKKTITNLKGTFQIFKETGKAWSKRSQTHFDNMCKMTYSRDTIHKCFDGRMKESPTCTLEAGNYTLKNLTFEDDLRATVGKNMFYGRYKFEVTIKGLTDGKIDSAIEFEVIVWINDADLKQHAKQVNDHSGASRSNRGNQGRKLGG